MLGNFFIFCCRLLTFFKINFFSKNSSRNTIRLSNVLDPDQDRHSVGPDLGPNCLQRKGFKQQTTKVAARKERVKDYDGTLYILDFKLQ